jgi:hypothetical protein
MTRTFLITNVHGEQSMKQASTAAHENMTAVERAMREGNVTSANGQLVSRFHFDVIDFTKSIKTESLRNRCLGSLAFMADAYIQGALATLLADYYTHSKETESAEKFVDYQTFLDHIAGYEANAESLYETGLDVKDQVQAVRNLLAFRAEAHAAIAGQLRDPSSYVTPSLSEKLANPTVRRVSAKAEIGYKALATEDATDDTGVIDVELETEVFEQYKLKAKAKKIDAFNFDKMKAASLVALLSCIKADVYDASDVADDGDAFNALDARRQAGILTNLRATINQVRIDAVEDNRITAVESATLRLESKPMLKQIEKLLGHSHFDTPAN